MSLGFLPEYASTYVYYKLDSTTDSSGNARTATLTGSPTFAYPGKYETTGLDITAAQNAKYTTSVVDPSAQDYSAGVWYKSNSMADGDVHYIMDCRANGAGKYVIIGLYYVSATPALYLRHLEGDSADTTYVIANTSGTISAFLGAWHHYGISVTHASTTANYYIDGVDKYPAGFSFGAGGNTSSGMWVGSYSDATNAGHGFYSHAWEKAILHTSQWWRRYYAWSVGKLV